MKVSRRDIVDALTSDSSMDGCDGDWRREVLFNASASDLDFATSELSYDELDKETVPRLRREGKL